MKFKKIVSTVLVFVICVVLLLFSACSEGPTPETTNAVCILYGNSKNAPLPDNNTLNEEIAQMAENNTNCSIIVIDGTSDSVSYKDTINYPKTAVDIVKESNNKDYVNQIINDINNACMPKTEEIDIIGALYNANKVLLKENVSNKKIILFSSGISTKGVLDFSSDPDLINEDPQTIVNMLNESNSLPDLSGVTVVWHGFGVVEKPQERLTTSNEQKLKTIWTEILKACNVKNADESVTLDIGTVSDDEYIKQIKENYPLVSAAIFSDDIVLDEERVEFKGDSAEFVDENKVYEELRPYAKLMIESKYKKFYLIGSTASVGSNDGCIRLSYDRAEAVKKVLCSLGVPESYLDVYGIGRENITGDYKWRENDLNEDGTLNEEVARKNRKVMIIKEDSKTGKEFMDIWNTKMNK